MSEPKLEVPAAVPSRIIIETKWIYGGLTIAGVFIGWILTTGMDFASWKTKFAAVQEAHGQEIKSIQDADQKQAFDYQNFKLELKEDVTAINTKLDILLSERKK